MSIFEGLPCPVYRWKVTSERELTEKEKNAVAFASVSTAKFGLLVCFLLKAGGRVKIPLSSQCILPLGTKIDVEKVKILTLSKPGEHDIYRVLV